jgi:predicted DNA binding CopG/RHH family protein
MKNKKTIGLRFPSEDVELLKKVCNARGENLSSFIRRSTKKN